MAKDRDQLKNVISLNIVLNSALIYTPFHIMQRNTFIPQNGHSTPSPGRSGGRGTPSPSRQDNAGGGSTSTSRGGRSASGATGRGRGRMSYYEYSTPFQQRQGRTPGGGGNSGSKSAFYKANVFGSGLEAVKYEKEKKLWKVGPVDGHRFQLAAFLRGLSRFLEFQLEQLASQPPPRNGRRTTSSPMPLSLASEALDQLSSQESTPNINGVVLEAIRSPDPTEPLVAAEEESFSTARFSSTGGGQILGENAKQGMDDSLEDPAVTAASPVLIAGNLDNRMVGMSVGQQEEEEEEGGIFLLQGQESEELVVQTEAEDNCYTPSIILTPETSADGIFIVDDVSTISPSPQEILEDTANSLSQSSSRNWWPGTSLDLLPAGSLPRNRVASAEEEAARTASAAAAAAARSSVGPLELSLRLERLDLTDKEASMMAEWAEAAAQQGTAVIRKLWLFGNRLGDEGAVAVAKLLSSGRVTECHLSHNLITLQGAEKLLKSVPVAMAGAVQQAEAAAPMPVAVPDSSEGAAPSDVTPSDDAHNVLSAPLWLRLEWNRISLGGLVGVLDAQHAQRGLLVDIPESAKKDAAPPLPQLPAYLAQAKAGKAAAPMPSIVPRTQSGNSAFTRSTKNQLDFIIEQCHCRLPWISSQFETPAEAAVLQTARKLWKSGNSSRKTQPAPRPSHGTAQESASAPNIGQEASIDQLFEPSTGPLLLLPDTSAMLAMVGADPSLTAPTFFTFEWLFSLSGRNLFGRSLSATEQTFIVVPASVATQLDGLKTDPGARGAVRRFMSKGLDDMGPAGENFVTMLGAHEGEGLVLEHGAEVAGSRGGDVSSKGQATDHRIVEVGLFFQNECLSAAGESHKGLENDQISGGNEGKCVPERALPVILLTNDNGQAQLAKAHGLPVVRMGELAAARAAIMSVVESGQPLTATVIRAALRNKAIVGLGSVAARSLQTEFDGAVACLRAALETLVDTQTREARIKDLLEDNAAASDAEKVALVKKALEEESSAGGEAVSGLVSALQRRLQDWDQIVRSHQEASRVLKWSTSGKGGG